MTSSPQRLENLGRLKEKKQRAMELAVLMHGYRQKINSDTNPHRPIEELDTAALSVVWEQLEKAMIEHRTLCEEIRALCEDLGEPMPHLDLTRRS